MSDFLSMQHLYSKSQQKRNLLAEHWPTAIEVSRQMGDPTGRIATTLRNENKLLAVYLPEGKGHYRYPSWQFDPHGRPCLGLEEVLSILHSSGIFTDSQGQLNGWGVVEWFMSLHALLQSQSPLEFLSKDPVAVIKAAKEEFSNP